MKKMTEDDKEFLKEFLQRSGFVGIVVGLFILFVALLGQSQNPPVEQQSTKVVGAYEGCDIIQWNYGSRAEYKYFLYCNKDDRSN